jgi:RHS repeat-associated protein
MNSKLYSLLAVCLSFFTLPSSAGSNLGTPPPSPTAGNCDKSGAGDDESFAWSIEVGLARYNKPDGFVNYAQLAYEPNGSLSDFAALYDRGFSQEPLQESQVILELSQPQIGAATFHPSCLYVHSEAAANEFIKKPAAGGFPEFIHQVVTSDRFTLIDLLPAPESGWRLRVWKKDAIAPALLTKSGAFYITTGFEALPPSKPPLKDVIFKRPVGTTGNNTLLLQFKEASGVAGVRSITAERVQTVDSAGRPLTLAYKLFSGEGTTGPLLSQQNLIYSERGAKAWDYTIVREVLTSSLTASGTVGPLTLTARSREDYDDFSTTVIGGVLGMKRLVSRTDAFNVTGQSPQTTIHTYIQSPGNWTIHGRLKSTTKPDGSWSFYEYNMSPSSPVSTATEYSGWQDLTVAQRANARKTVTQVSKNESTAESYVAGQLVSKAKNTFSAGANENLTTSEKWNGTAWHITTTAYHLDNAPAPNTSRIKWIENSDGTATTYSYATTSGNLVATSRTGAGSRAGITAGTEVKTTYGPGNFPIAQITKDIATNLVIEQWDTDPTYNGGFDQLGRPIKRIFNADVDDYDIAQYACCGLEFARDRMGATTQYFRDGLKRVYKTESKASAVAACPAVTSFTTIDGLTTTQTRRFGSSDTLFLGSSTRSLDGLTRSSTGPSRKSTLIEDRPVTTTVITRSATGDTETTTHADFSTSITASYLDGRPKSTSGTAVPDMSYDYDTHNENGGGEKSMVTASGVVSTTFTDLLGRTSKIISAATGTTNYDYYPMSISSAPGSRGKLKSVTDGDNVTLTYGYNTEGQRTTTSRSIPLAGGATATQITTTEQDVVSDITLHGTSLGIARRNTQTISSTGIDPITTSQTLISRDGLTSGSIALSGNTLSVATRPDATSGIATQTTTYPDGTKSKATKHHDLLTTVATLKTDDSVITSTNYAYDPLQRLLTSTDARTGLSTYDLNADGLADVTESGRPLAVKAPANHTTSYAYDILGRVTTLDAPDTLDASGVTLANISYTAYYPTGQVKVTWGSQTYPTWNVYDEQGRQTQLHTWKIAPTLILASIPENPPNGSEVTTWIFSPTTGHLVEKNYPGETDNDTIDADYAYTPGGRLFTRTSERGITTTYSYTHGLMTSTDYSDNTPDVAITYEPLGRRQSVSTNVAKSEFTYDPATLAPDTETISYNLDTSPGYEFFRVLDRTPTSLGRDTGWQLKDGTTIENQASYAYHATDGRLFTIAGGSASSPPSFTYNYVPNSNLLHTVSGPIHTVINQWEDNRDVLDIKQNKVGTSDVSKYDYAVNELGQRTGVNTSGSEFPALPAWLWGYDSLGQVTSANHSDGNTHDRAYQYDAIGNRKKSANSLTLPTDDNYSTNALNQYTVAVGVALPVTPAPAPHDQDGNLRFDGGVNKDNQPREYLWDAENRQIEVKNAAGTTIEKNVFDSGSRRIATTANGVTTVFLYEGFNCIAEYELNIQNSSFNIVKTRLWGTDLSGTLQGAGGVGGLLSESHISNPQSPIYYPTYDGNGNVSEYLKADGDVSVHFEYDPFGNTVVNTDTSNQFAYRFSTKPLDFVTGLYYYTYRYYDPVTGRWPSRDPIEEQGGINLYGFVGNDGVNRFDVLGLCDKSKKWGCKITKSIISSDETEEAIEQAIALQAIIQGIDNYGDIMALVGVKNLAELGEGLAGLSTDEVDVLTSQALEITISTNSTADDFRKVIIRLTVEYSTYDSDCCEETQTEDSESGPYKNAREAERKVKDEERKAIKSICK